MVLPQGIDATNRVAPSYCPFCGNLTRDYDAEEQQRKHLNALLSQAYLHAALPHVPVTYKPSDCTKIEVPWARPGTEFTQLFEALVFALIRRIPVKLAAALLVTNDARLWRFVDREGGEEVSWGPVAGSPAVAGRPGGKGVGQLNLFYDLEVTFDIQTGGKESAAPGAGPEPKTANRGKVAALAAVTFEMSQALILAAFLARAGATLGSARFRSIKDQNDTLGMVPAEEGRLYPGKSRAPPRRIDRPQKRLASQQV